MNGHLAGSLFIEMSANVARIQSDMNATKGIVGGAMKNIESAVASAKSALGALGIGLGIGYFTSLIKGTIDAADHLNDLTQSLGMNMQALAKYKLAAEQSGTSLEGIGKGIKGLTNAFAEHGDELRAAGITAKTADGQIRQLSDIFSKMPDGLEKTTLATKLFGKSGMELIPMLNMGAAGLDETADKSAKYAAVLATLGPQADKFNDTMAELWMASKVASMAIVNDALPAITRIAVEMAAAAQESGSFAAAFVGMGGFVYEGLAGWGRALHLYWLQLNAYLDDAAAKMMRFLGASKDAAMFANSANEFKLKAQQLLEANPAAAPQAQKQFDTAAWTKQYKELIAALGLGKKEAEDSDSAYRNLLKTLKEKLLLDRELTEVNKLQLALDALSAKQRAQITPEREKELKLLAATVDLNKRRKEQMENDAKNEEALEKMRQEGREASAAYEAVRGNAILAADKQIKQMELETTLIGATNVQRETELFLYQAKIDKIDALTIARMKEAIAASHAAKEAKDLQVGMWQSVESAGHQAFLSIFDTSKSVLERIRDMLKTHLIDILYQVTLKKWIVQIAVGTSGAGVAQSAFGSTGGGVGGMSMGSMASMITGGADSLFQSAGVSMGSQWIADIGNYGFGLPFISGLAMAATGNIAGGIGSTLGGIAGSYFGPIGTAIGSALGGMIGSALGGGDDERQAQLVGAGITGGSSINRAGFAGTQFANFGSSPTDFWAGTQTAALPADALAGFNKAIAQVFSDAEAAAKQLGLSTTSLNTLTVALAQSGQGVQQDMQAALLQTADTIALALMPNLRDFQQGSETLAQTFGRLAAAQAALDAQRRTMEIRLMEAQGDAIGALAAKREDELAALDATLRPLMQQIYAAEDLAEATRKASDAAKDLADSYGDVTRTLLDTIAELRGGELSTLTPQQKLLAARSTLDAVYGKALTGDLEALDRLSRSATDFLAASRGYNASSAAYTADYGNVIDMLDKARMAAGGYAAPQVPTVSAFPRYAAAANDSSAVVAELRAVKAEVVTLQATVQRQTVALATVTERSNTDNAETISTAIGRTAERRRPQAALL